ncbi:MAG: hypothetical protein QXT63_06325, partial [Thermoplasmata archaeon]
MDELIRKLSGYITEALTDVVTSVVQHTIDQMIGRFSEELSKTGREMGEACQRYINDISRDIEESIEKTQQDLESMSEGILKAGEQTNGQMPLIRENLEKASFAATSIGNNLKNDLKDSLSFAHDLTKAIKEMRGATAAVPKEPAKISLFDEKFIKFFELLSDKKTLPFDLIRFADIEQLIVAL